MDRLERAILEGLRKVLRKPTKIKAQELSSKHLPAWYEKNMEVTESMDYKPVIRWTDRKPLVGTGERFGRNRGLVDELRTMGGQDGGKCVVHSCEASAVTEIELHSISVKIRVCEFHSDLLKQLDGDAIYEAVHLGHVETSSMGRIVAYEEVFPDVDDGDSSPPATQAAMRVSDGAFIRHRELLEAGYEAIFIDHGDGNNPEVEWIDPYAVTPYSVELEEIITGEIMTAMAPHERPDFINWATNKKEAAS